MEKLKEQLMNLLEVEKEEEEIILKYLEKNSVEDLFKDYKELSLKEDTEEQIESLMTILEKFKDM